jgi:hypothetical protein
MPAHGYHRSTGRVGSVGPVAAFLGGAVSNLSDNFDSNRQSKRETAKATTIAKYRSELLSVERQRLEGRQDQLLAGRNTRQDQLLADQNARTDALHDRGLLEMQDTRAANREDFLWKQQNTVRKPDNSMRIAYAKLAGDIRDRYQNGEIDQAGYDAAITQARQDLGLATSAPAGNRMVIDPSAVEKLMAQGADPAAVPGPAAAPAEAQSAVANEQTAIQQRRAKVTSALGQQQTARRGRNTRQPSKTMTLSEIFGMKPTEGSRRSRRSRMIKDMQKSRQQTSARKQVMTKAKRAADMAKPMTGATAVKTLYNWRSATQGMSARSKRELIDRLSAKLHSPNDQRLAQQIRNQIR